MGNFNAGISNVAIDSINMLGQQQLIISGSSSTVSIDQPKLDQMLEDAFKRGYEDGYNDGLMDRD